MENLGIYLTPVMTMILVSLIIPMIASSRQQGDLDATRAKCVKYGDTSLLLLRIFSVLLYLLTVVAIVCTILCIIDPEMMEFSSDDILGICFMYVLCIFSDIFTSYATITFTRRIYYDEQSFTDIKPFNKKKMYLFSDITGITNTVSGTIGVQTTRKGNLKIYFGEECVKIPAQMYGIAEFISVLRINRKDIKF